MDIQEIDITEIIKKSPIMARLIQGSKAGRGQGGKSTGKIPPRDTTGCTTATTGACPGPIPGPNPRRTTNEKETGAAMSRVIRIRESTYLRLRSDPSQPNPPGSMDEAVNRALDQAEEHHHSSRPGEGPDMSRELRKVPAHHQHPRKSNNFYIPTPREEQAQGDWFQVYETVTQGTPVTPPFQTLEELEEHLVKNGDTLTQRGGYPPPPRKSIRKFLAAGYADKTRITPDGTLDPYANVPEQPEEEKARREKQ